MSKKHSREHHEEHADESWLIPYADLMTLLLALFIVLYAMSSLDAKKFQQVSQAFSVAFNSGTGVLDQPAIQSNGEASSKKTIEKVTKEQQDSKFAALIKQEQENMEELKQKIDTYIKDNHLTSQLNTTLNYTELMITVSDTALFDSGSAAVKEKGYALATTIAKMMEQYPDYEVIVSGHTDNRPISTLRFPSNWELSSARAINFLKIMLDNSNINPNLFSAIGYGEHRPLNENTNEKDKSKNRRVEISILRKYIDPSYQQLITVE